jgi:hypothetical protein
MATFTFRSITSSIIEVQTGAGTLFQLYTDAIAHTPGCMTNPSVDIYQVENNREIEIENGVSVTVEEGNTLQWNLSSDKQYVLDVQAGATIIANLNSTIIFSMSSSYHGDVTCPGSFIAEGTKNNEVKLKAFRYFYLRSLGYADGDNYILNHVIIEDLHDTNSYIRMDWSCSYDKNSFLGNVQFLGNTGRGFLLESQIHDPFIMENMIIDGLYQGVAISSCAKLINSTVKNCINYGLFSTGLQAPRFPYYTQKYTTGSSVAGQNLYLQPKVTFENCLFENNYGGSWGVAYSYGSRFKLKDCEIKNVSIGIRADYGSIFLLESVTFTNVSTPLYWDRGGAIYDVFPLSLTVQDENDNLIDDATVFIEHSLGYEKDVLYTVDPLSFQTADPSFRYQISSTGTGNTLDLYGDNPVFVHREILSNTPTYEYWSDSIEDNRYHIITVNKLGYKTWRRKVTFNQDVTLTATLIPENKVKTLPVEF